MQVKWFSDGWWDPFAQCQTSAGGDISVWGKGWLSEVYICLYPVLPIPPLCDIFFWGPHDITRYFGNWYDNHTIFTIFYKRKYVQNLHFFLLKARSGDSWQLAKKRVDYNFFGNLYFPVSDHLWGVYFDFLCHFHLKKSFTNRHFYSPIGTFSVCAY